MNTVRPEVRANILVVNDHPEQLVALGAVLSPLGENLVMARSGEEALRTLLQQEFAVVLLDVHMPRLDGFETAALMRQRGRSRATPIIFITAYGQEDAQIERSYSLGAVDFIQTPIIPEILRAKVSVFIQLYKKSEELRLIREVEHRRELEVAQEKLEAETKRNLFFVLSIDLLAVADFAGYFLQINPAWEKALGLTEEDLKAEPFYEFAHPEDRPSTLQQLKRLREGTAITYFEHRFRNKEGCYKWLGWTAAPFAADKLIYIFARDITGHKEAEDEIRELNRKLEARVAEVTATNHELESFSYSISHDLRAPLRSMEGFAQMLATEFCEILPEQGREYARRIAESAAYMDQLLRDLLEYSRVSRSELNTSLVNLDSLIKEVVDSIQNEINQKEARIQIVHPLAYVVANHAIVKQMLANLIGNALKFTASGIAPRIRIWTEGVPGQATSALPTQCHMQYPGKQRATGPEPQHCDGAPAKIDRCPENLLRLFVQDNGIGIEPDQHEKIFGLFQRGHSAETYAGTGIGLAIVRKGAERMGGKAGVESSPGKGSCFWLDLPAPAVHVESKAA